MDVVQTSLYDPGEVRDEALLPGGAAAPEYEPLFDGLAGCDLAALRRHASEIATAQGMVFQTDDEGPHAFHLDVVPRLFSATEWDRLADGISQRVTALNAFLADVYGERLIAESGRVPERILEVNRFEPDARELSPPFSWAGIVGLDVVRGADGELMVLEDNLRAPSGISYALSARATLDEVLPFEPPVRREEPPVSELLLDTLRAAAPKGREDPCVVILSDGPANSAWWEHSRLAELLDVPLLTPGDLGIRGGALFADLGDGSPRVRVDVVYRRTDEHRLRDEHGRPTWLSEALLEPLRRGTLACVNAFGTAIADDKLAHAYVEEMIRFYLGEEPRIRSVPTYDLGEPSARAMVLDRIEELVIKPRDGYGGAGVIVCAHASREDRVLARDLIRKRPESYIAQETICFSTHPTVVDGTLQPRHVDLRPFAFCRGSIPEVMPGGLTRVALDAGALVVNSSQNGGGKDTWVLDR